MAPTEKPTRANAFTPYISPRALSFELESSAEAHAAIAPRRLAELLDS